MKLLLVVLSLLLGAAQCSGEGCGGYPSNDPCLPGGVWDTVLKRCTGIDSQPCYQCYSGDYCKTKEDPLQCKLASVGGNPVYLSEYWTGGHSTEAEPCTQTPGHYRPAYQGNHYSTKVEENIFPPLKEAILQLHKLTGNAETEGYFMVTGMGATMVIHSALAVISKRILQECSSSLEVCPTAVDVFAQAPYYPGYIFISSNCPNTRWNASADPNSPFTIEILTYPDNPSGVKRNPLVMDPSRVVMDMVYYWPMYTEINAKLDHPLMVFSSSKHGGLAGTRFGWGLVKDKDLAVGMLQVVDGIMLDFSIDVQLRVLNGLQVVLEEANKTQTHNFPFHEFGHEVISSRFKGVSDLFSSCPGLSLTNQLSSTGGYAWIMCSAGIMANGSCEQVLERVNLYGIEGSVFGAMDNYVRLSMLLPTVEFDTLFLKLKYLCSMLG
ncbi:uncharacterized protein LOC135335756 [Halichondria panicea]|uniref:uncharacterized protein LOC135335756 n=1 Tax=Halichondria panicea TaxID=6063 RepID=UPI00312BBFC2